MLFVFEYFGWTDEVPELMDKSPGLSPVRIVHFRRVNLQLSGDAERQFVTINYLRNMIDTHALPKAQSI